MNDGMIKQIKSKIKDNKKKKNIREKTTKKKK